MTRGISGAMLSALQAQVVRPIYLTKIEFVGSDVYLSSTNNNVSWNAQTWLGNGQLKSSINGIHEQGDTEATGCKVVLEAFDSALMSLLLTATNRSKTASIYLGALDSSEAIIVDPQLVYSGYFDNVEFTENGEQSQATMSFENELIGLKRINEFRYTHESQQVYFPGDLCFEYAALVPDWSGFWGKAARPKRTKKRDRTKN